MSATTLQYVMAEPPSCSLVVTRMHVLAGAAVQRTSKASRRGHRVTLASVAEQATHPGYYSGGRTDIINAHADLRAALDMLVKAAHLPIPDVDRDV